jgi:hypothetical protein
MRMLIAILVTLSFGTRVVRADDAAPAALAVIVPEECKEFVPPPFSKDPAFWDRWLSLASCVLDVETPRVSHPFEVPDMIEYLTLAYQPSILMWQRALERAPLETQLRAGYHIGLAMVAYMTQARSSLAAPDDMPKPQATKREVLLRERVEPLLAIPKRLAWTAFRAISDHAIVHSEFEKNPVHRAMVRSARAHLRWLETPREPHFPEPAQTLHALH